MNTTSKFIAYFRVSTKQQGDSGLGLESQQAIVNADVGTPFMTFTEVASGTTQREILDQAIAACKLHGATLVVAKLDRLTRNVALACELLASGVQIRVCGMPHMSTMVFQMLCVVAEEEARLISQRTKSALAAAKARGVKLGSAREGHWQGREHLRGPRPGTKLAPVNQSLVMQIKQLQDAGHTNAQIAKLLNAQGHRAPKGGDLHPAHIHRMSA